MPASAPLTFYFRPRFRGIAWTAVAFGGVLDILAGVIGFPGTPLIVGTFGVVLGGAYLVSPTWRIAVTIDDEALCVGSSSKPRFRLPWSEVVKLTVAKASSTAFVDGGEPARSLLVPGDGAPAPYDIDDRPGLVRALVEHVAEDKITYVASLADAPPPPPA